MEDDFLTLRSLLQIISEQTNIHICVHDVSGILKVKALNLETKNSIHSKEFCSAAKKSPYGYRLCIKCKMLANKKAITNKVLFHSYCPYGLYEVVKPVTIEGKVQCIIYIGNIIFSEQVTSQKIHHACTITKSPENLLLSYMKKAQIVQSIDYFVELANFISKYIFMLYERNKLLKNDDDNQYHWAVSALKNYVDLYYNQNLSLRTVSKLYYINNKYIGRLFKKQTGMTFHEYLNKVRLDNAVSLLLNSKNSIVNIALKSGFQNVTYFNRLFREKFNIPPVKFRALNRS